MRSRLHSLISLMIGVLVAIASSSAAVQARCATVTTSVQAACCQMPCCLERSSGDKAPCCCDIQPSPASDDPISAQVDSKVFKEPATAGNLDLPKLEPYELHGFQAINEHVQLRAPPVKLYILYLALLN